MASGPLPERCNGPSFTSHVCGWPDGHYYYPDLATGAKRWEDGDGDGLPVAWEDANNVSSPLADEDGDGFLNIEEWACGANPNSPLDSECTGPPTLGQVAPGGERG